VASQFFVVATPQEFVQVLIVDDGLPHSVGQSGLQVITPVGVHGTLPFNVHAADGELQQIVEPSPFLHLPSTESQVSPCRHVFAALQFPHSRTPVAAFG